MSERFHLPFAVPTNFNFKSSILLCSFIANSILVGMNGPHSTKAFNTAITCDEPTKLLSLVAKRCKSRITKGCQLSSDFLELVGIPHKNEQLLNSEAYAIGRTNNKGLRHVLPTEKSSYHTSAYLSILTPESCELTFPALASSPWKTSRNTLNLGIPFYMERSN
jgi:hypothetical protein